MKPLSLACSCALLGTIHAFSLTSAAADTKTWTGTSNSAYASGSNWSSSGGGFPASGDDVVIDNLATREQINLGTDPRAVKSFLFSRTSAGAFVFRTGNAAANPIVGYSIGSLTVNGGAGTPLIMRSNQSSGTGGSGNLDLAISGNLLVQSELRLGDFTSNDGVTSGIYSFVVGGTTTLGSGGILTFSRLANSSDSPDGKMDLGALQLSGGTLHLTAGEGGSGSDVLVENVVTVRQLNGTSGLIQANKAGSSAHLLVDATVDGAFGGVIRDQAAGAVVRLTKDGDGTLTLSGVNDYSGATAVQGGTLEIAAAGSISNASEVNIGAGGRFVYNSATTRTGAIDLQGNGAASRAVLSGTGVIGAALTLDDVGDTLSPGDGVGTQVYSVSQEWDALTYLWEINDFTGMDAGTAFDRIAIEGSLDLNSSGQYQLDLVSLTLLDLAGDVGNFVETDRFWNILTTEEGITGFNASNWTLLTDHFSAAPGVAGAWSLDLSQDARSLILSYHAIPEPGTVLLVGVGAGLLLIRRRRRSF